MPRRRRRWEWTGSAALLAVVLAAALPGRAQADGLHVIPFPGTPDAAPSSQVIFSSLARSDLSSVKVIGSLSGGHAGHLTVLPDGAGTAFVPNRRFAPAEAVRVTADLSSPAAGTRSGDPGATALRFSFKIASGTPTAARRAAAPATRSAGDAGAGRTQSFISRPDLHPPVVSATSDPDGASGDFFLTPRDSPQNGAMILNARGQLVWFAPVRGAALDLAVQRYLGQPVLTYWRGKNRAPVGADVILDRSYRTLAVVHAGNGYSADGHEFQITPQGTALLDVYTVTTADLSSVEGPTDGRVVDCIIQEVDIRTGQVLWEWHALGHIPFSDSYVKPLPRAYPYFHLNSIQQLPDGNLLVSARNTWTVYEISKSTGDVLWTLGGKHSSFKMGPGTNFEWQHDARMHPGGILSLFDDAGLPQEEPQSSAMLLKLDTTPGSMTATLVRRITHSPPLLASALGNFQTLPNGNFVVDWGTQPEFSEYTSTGRQIFNASLPLGVNSYRTFRFAWHAQPAAPPAMANLPASDGAVAVFASWNGATDVAAWRVLGGPGPRDLTKLGQGAARGFETGIALAGEPRYLAVQALDRSGHVLGTSGPQLERPHLAVFGSQAFVSASSGRGTVPVGCFTGSPCRVGVRITAGSTVLAQWTTRTLRADAAAPLRFKLSPSAALQIAQAPEHRLAVKVSAREGLVAATVPMTLSTYSVSGPPPARSASPSRAVRLADTDAFVSRAGRGVVLTGCPAATTCRVQAVIRRHGRVIAASKSQALGTRELGYVSFQLTAAGRADLREAPGNQLGAHVSLTSRGVTATGQIDLIGYG